MNIDPGLRAFAEVAAAMESYMNDDALGYAEVASEAERYATRRHGCTPHDIRKAFELLGTSDPTGEVSEKALKCFGAWYVKMKYELIQKGYL